MVHSLHSSIFDLFLKFSVVSTLRYHVALSRKCAHKNEKSEENRV